MPRLSLSPRPFGVEIHALVPRTISRPLRLAGTTSKLTRMRSRGSACDLGSVRLGRATGLAGRRSGMEKSQRIRRIWNHRADSRGVVRAAHDDRHGQVQGPQFNIDQPPGASEGNSSLGLRSVTRACSRKDRRCRHARSAAEPARRAVMHRWQVSAQHRPR